MKRVRSKKIENDKNICVLYEREIDASCLQEYSGAIFSTGVEREEEEEHHLKEVISGREENIPTPPILLHRPEPIIKKRKLMGSAERKAGEEKVEDLEYLGDPGDVPNLYVPETEEGEGGGEEKAPLEENPPPGCTILQQEKEAPASLLPYVCFRKREVKALRKARKPDTSIEKIKKIKIDLQIIRRLAELTVQRDAYLLQHLNTVLSIFNICREMNRRLDVGVLSTSESIIRDILFTKLISKSDRFHKKIPSFNNLYTCRKTIGSLRRLFKAGPSEEDLISLTTREIDHLNEYIR